MHKTETRRRPWGRWVALAAGLVSVTAVASVGVATWAWGSSLDADDRLLPGATIAGTAVGELAADEAIAAVTSSLDDQLDRVVTVEHDGQTWEVTPRDVGAGADVEGAVLGALDATTSASYLDLVRFRWLGETSDLDVEVPVVVPQDGVADFVDDLAADIDHDPVDAGIELVDGEVTTTDHQDGERLDRDASTAALYAALDGDTSTVMLEVEPLTAALDSQTVTAVLPRIEQTVDRALDRSITFSHDGNAWTTTPRDLGAQPDLAPAVDAARQAATDGGDGDALDAPVPLTVPDDAIDTFVASIAADVDVAAVDAELTTTGDGISITPDQPGLAVDRSEARQRLVNAVTGSDTDLAVPTATVQAGRTADSYERVLVLRQSDRELDLYVEGEVATTWPVAVGTGGSPTPTGTFTVGAKRFEPTWVNPAPDRWGADMPDRIGPGPDNPLGVRALNWNNAGGADTLIRFHGTPNEASIGEASSNGCVRMFNEDVVELYDRVSSGTTIISLA